MSEEKHSLRERLAPMLPKFLMILLILQPLMDILSFWTDRLGMSNTITLLLRFAVFAVVCVLGFVTSSRKKVYGIAIAACAFLLVGHCISCFIVGYQRIVYDLTNFVRVVQMPLFVLCFISFLRANNKCYRAFETGLMLDFWIITASVVVSVLTHTSSATYQSTNVGILGWYSFGNAQSAIMSILAPIVILLCYRRKNFLLFTVTSVAALAQLYLMGTRLAFFSIAVAALGVPVVLVLTGKARTSKRYIAVLVLILAACCATYKQSPMYINQNRYNIFDRTVERNGLKETAKKLGKGLITFSPLEQGLLTNRYLNGVPADSRIAHDGRFLKESALTPERLQQIRDLNDIAAERGQTLAEMALAWLLHDGYVTSVLVGASRPQQLLVVAALGVINHELVADL